MVRTRFAPSPTGFLHVGGLRTALYNYLFAKQNGGKFVLRIEDTDRERYVEGGVENIIKSLAWSGIKFDEGPFEQSKRLDIYHRHVEQLIKEDHAYYCFCSAERLENLRQKQKDKKIPTGYDGLCRDIDPKEAGQRVQAGERHVIRMKMPVSGETVFNDLIRGEVRFKNELVDDQVLIKSDGYPTYHLAVVVDDHEMKITHIIRGEEWISSVPKHIQLYNFFGWDIPQMAHLPLLLNPDKSKLSKRQGDVSVEDYRQKGYLPEALVNFVAFLGWNPGTDKEFFSLKELVKEFDITKAGRAGAVFNVDKLDWYNKEYIKKLSDKELAKIAEPWFNANKEYSIENKELIERAVGLERERITTLSELPGALKFVFVLPDYPSDLLVWKKSNRQEVAKILPELAKLLNTFSVQAWNMGKLEQGIGEWLAEKGYSVGAALWPMRVALSGQQNSPGPFEIAEVLGKAESLARLDKAIAKII
ncbi:glutamate--tRNA ligase [Patescibacteria group bacterium]|nr:MAG: glutamate--tRNA ligase [Patescibacteria group bacterium]